MSNEVLEYYQNLNFTETEIEDGLTALAFDFAHDESYTLLTTEEGTLPTGLKQPVLLTYYSPEGAFQWSVSFKNAYVFKDIWSAAIDPEHKLAAVLEYRASREL